MPDTGKTILVTGGAGYIGSHTVVVLLERGFDVLVLDNLSNSKPAVFERIERITGRRPAFVEGDIRDADLLDRIFADHAVDAVIHFAGLKAVGQSVAEPLLYYDNNVSGSITLFESMRRAGCRRLVFSSSATVYGMAENVPIAETQPLRPTNPYGGSKAAIEQILGDLAHSDARWRIAMLRYFNPVGAHESGLIGEDPAGVPNNLMPYIAQVAVGRLARLTVHGNDYPTRDGTGERDYIHVVDLARGHLAALDALAGLSRVAAVNLGTGRGYTVLEVVNAFERASGQTIPYSLGARRDGDVATSYADTRLAHDLLGWAATLDIDRMCADAWRWQRLNPRGYE